MLAVTHESQCLVAERGHGGEASAEAGGDQDAQVVVDEPAVEREGHHETDDEAAENVHDQRSRREPMVREVLDDSGEPVASDATNQPSDGDECVALKRKVHGTSGRRGREQTSLAGEVRGWWPG